MEIVIADDVPILDQPEARVGSTVRQVILVGDTADGCNFRLYRSHYQSGEAAFESPRHTHAFQQIRWTQSGRVNYGPGQDIEEDDLAYFPRGAWYGPQRKEDAIGLLLQFGFNGDHQAGPLWDAMRPEALRRLLARGRLEGGMYKSTDPETGRAVEIDAAQALYQERFTMHLGEKFTVPPPRYEGPVLMHTKRFTYFDTAPGVSEKMIGQFFDTEGPAGDLRVKMVRLSGSGGYPLSSDRAQIGWAKAPGLAVRGRAYGDMTCFYSPLGESDILNCDQSVEIYLIELPRGAGMASNVSTQS